MHASRTVLLVPKSETNNPSVVKIYIHCDGIWSFGDGDCLSCLQTSWTSQRTASEWWLGLPEGRLRANRPRRPRTPCGGSSARTRRSDTATCCHMRFTLHGWLLSVGWYFMLHLLRQRVWARKWNDDATYCITYSAEYCQILLCRSRLLCVYQTLMSYLPYHEHTHTL